MAYVHSFWSPKRPQVDAQTDEASILRIFQLLGYGLSQGERPLLLAACTALERICESIEAFVTLLKAKGVEYMLSFLRHLPQAHVSPSLSEAVNAAAASMKD